METKQRIYLLLAVLVSLSGVSPAAATDDAASAYLPLAVGNSWTYSHEYLDHSEEDLGILKYSAYWEQWPGPYDPFVFPEFTISVLNTEVIDGKTYYVLSEMPANWPPAPPYFIAGKKLRWAGTHLMERTADGERSVFRFDGANDTGYTVDPDGVDNLIIKVRLSSPDPSLAHIFDFRGTEQGKGDCAFCKNYGCVGCNWRTVPRIDNYLTSIRAVLGGRTVEYKDLSTPTSTSIPSSWGQVKEVD